MLSFRWKNYECFIEMTNKSPCILAEQLNILENMLNYHLTTNLRAWKEARHKRSENQQDNNRQLLEDKSSCEHYINTNTTHKLKFDKTTTTTEMLRCILSFFF